MVQRLLPVPIVPSILAFLLLPFVRILEGRGVPRWLASTRLVLAILVVAGRPDYGRPLHVVLG